MKKMCTVAMVFAIICVACSRSSQSPPKELRVGVILPLTGTLAEMGSYERSAMELAERKPAGFPLRLIFEDSRSGAQGAVTAANKLINADHVQLLVTSTTGASLAVQPIAEAANVPLVAFCMDPTITDNHVSTVRFYIGIDEEAKQIVGFLATLPKTERIVILHAAVPVWRKVVTNTYVPFINRSFATPALVEEYNLQDKDFRSILTKISGNGTTTLVLLGYGFEYPPIYQQMDDLNLRSQLHYMVGGWGFLYSSLLASKLENTIVAGPEFIFQRNASGDAFAKEFEISAGRKANFDAAFAYELVKTLSGVRPDALAAPSIKDTLKRLGRQDGVIGNYYFSDRGDMIVTTGLGVYRNGVITPKDR